MPGKKAESPLSQMRTAAPCQQSWDTMSGNDQVRFCSTCYKNVYKFSHLNRAQAIQLVSANEGRACVTYYRRADGSVMAEECPVGLRRVQRPFQYAYVGLAAMLVPVLCFASLLGISKLAGVPTHAENGGHGLVVKLRARQPFAAMADWIDPPPPPPDCGLAPLAQLPTLTPDFALHTPAMSADVAYYTRPIPEKSAPLAPGYRMTLRKLPALPAPRLAMPPSAVAPTRHNEGHVAP